MGKNFTDKNLWHFGQTGFFTIFQKSEVRTAGRFFIMLNPRRTPDDMPRNQCKEDYPFQPKVRWIPTCAERPGLFGGWGMFSAHHFFSGGQEHQTNVRHTKTIPKSKGVKQNHWIDDWLGVWNMNFMTFHSVGIFIIPTDEVIFFRGVGIPPTRWYFNHRFQIWTTNPMICCYDIW